MTGSLMYELSSSMWNGPAMCATLHFGAGFHETATILTPGLSQHARRKRVVLLVGSVVLDDD